MPEIVNPSGHPVHSTGPNALPPGQDTATPFPVLPRSFDTEALNYLHNVVDNKISSAFANVKVLTPEEERADYRRQLMTKVGIGLVGVGTGIVISWAYRKIRGTDGDEDMGDGEE